MGGDRTPLVVIGAGGHGAEVAAYARDMELPLAGAFDDGKPRGEWHVTTIVGGMADLAAFCRLHAAVHYITAFGGNAVRRKVVERIAALRIPNLTPFTLAHPSAWTGASVQIGDGTLLAPNTLVTTRATIGMHCILNVKASVSHDCVVGDYCNINPGATIAGDVRLGEGCYIGAGATVIEKRTVGAWSVIGAGAVVTQDLPEGVTAVGVPARIVKTSGIPVFA
ncbi:MAG TPA: acetyltransferase [Gemmatimonadaceae bacterium]|nr:acetyltransferase [Gemmatimonadaceae bacterium]